MGNLTFTMIKPTAVKNKHIGNIIAKITEGGFAIKALRMKRMSKYEAEQFYLVHKERPFYNELTDFMSSGAVVAILLEKDNAVTEYRNFIGATKPDDAAEGTIRKLYGTDIQANAVHGSDSDENALLEASYFFSEFERY